MLSNHCLHIMNLCTLIHQLGLLRYYCAARNQVKKANLPWASLHSPQHSSLSVCLLWTNFLWFVWFATWAHWSHLIPFRESKWDSNLGVMSEQWCSFKLRKFCFCKELAIIFSSWIISSIWKFFALIHLQIKSSIFPLSLRSLKIIYLNIA